MTDTEENRFCSGLLLGLLAAERVLSLVAMFAGSVIFSEGTDDEAETGRREVRGGGTGLPANERITNVKIMYDKYHAK